MRQYDSFNLSTIFFKTSFWFCIFLEWCHWCECSSKKMLLPQHSHYRDLPPTLSKWWSSHTLKLIAPRGESVGVLPMWARVSSSLVGALSSAALVEKVCQKKMLKEIGMLFCGTSYNCFIFLIYCKPKRGQPTTFYFYFYFYLFFLCVRAFVLLVVCTSVRLLRSKLTPTRSLNLRSPKF